MINVLKIMNISGSKLFVEIPCRRESNLPYFDDKTLQSLSTYSCQKAPSWINKINKSMRRWTIYIFDSSEGMGGGGGNLLESRITSWCRTAGKKLVYMSKMTNLYRLISLHGQELPRHLLLFENRDYVDRVLLKNKQMTSHFTLQESLKRNDL